MMYLCNYFKYHTVTSDDSYDDYERAMVQQGHYPGGSSIRDWHYLYQ